MKNLVLAISLLFLVGCGGSSGTNSNPIDIVNNEGNYHNNYGFYGSKVKIGKEKFSGIYQVSMLKNGKKLSMGEKYQNDRMIYRFDNDGRLYTTIDGQSYEELKRSMEILGLDYNEDARWSSDGVYGVSKDGTKLKFDLNNEIYTESIYKGVETITGNECLVFSLTEKDNYQMLLCKTSI